MRVASAVARTEIAPGSAGSIPLDVVNTGDVIDALSVRVLGIPATATTRSEPELLTLFPQAEGELEVRIALPDSFPAGTYHVTLVVQGRTSGAVDASHDVEIVVPPQPAVAMTASPSLVRTRGRGLFTVTVANEGNVPLDLALRTLDADRTLRTSMTPSTLSVDVGRSAITTISARGPRQLLGSDRDRTLRVVAEAEGARAETTLTLRQRSTFSRGLLTILVLLAILAAWALAVTLGMREVLGGDPSTKVAPASFFAASAGTSSAAAAAPAGALPKDGLLPAGVGATLTGTVRGQEDPAGVGRLTVEALRTSRDGLVLVSSAATQSDGTYSLAGLFPGDYLLRIETPGYETLWFPDGTSSGSATPVAASAQQVTEGVDLAVVGDPASIAGVVELGGEDEVAVTVTATPTWVEESEEGGSGPAPQEVETDGEGGYLLEDLVAPGTYDLTFEAEGYQPTTVTERVLGGQERLALAVTMVAGSGEISGTVTDGFAPLGGVSVTTTVDGEEVEVGTPTVGQVGAFVVPSLPTPGTYVLTFAKEGYGTQTVVVDLAAGESRGDVRAVMTGGVGTVSGRVVDTDGRGIGGVTVTAGGTSAGITATTLTAGDVGAFTLTGVQGTGTVTLTFSREGYAPASVPVILDGEPPDDVRVTLSTALGSVQGRVLEDGSGVAGYRVEATDGTTVYSTTSTATGSSGRGSYVLDGLPSGTYTLSVVVDGVAVTSAQVQVRQGVASDRDLPLPEGG